MGGFLEQSVKAGPTIAASAMGGPVAGMLTGIGTGMLSDAMSGGNFMSGLMSGGMGGLGGYYATPKPATQPVNLLDALALRKPGDLEFNPNMGFKLNY